MAYATIADAELTYGVGAIAVVCDRDLSGAVDTTAFERQLDIASDQMDGYLLGRYGLPLASPPKLFTKLCVDIAVYNSALTADVRTLEMRQRYEDALAYLRDIALNKIKLVVASSATEVNQSAAADLVIHDVEIVEGAREFTRDALDGLL